MTVVFSKHGARGCSQGQLSQLMEMRAADPATFKGMCMACCPVPIPLHPIKDTWLSALNFVSRRARSQCLQANMLLPMYHTALNLESLGRTKKIYNLNLVHTFKLYYPHIDIYVYASLNARAHTYISLGRLSHMTIF